MRVTGGFQLAARLHAGRPHQKGSGGPFSSATACASHSWAETGIGARHRALAHMGQTPDPACCAGTWKELMGLEGARSGAGVRCAGYQHQNSSGQT